MLKKCFGIVSWLPDNDDREPRAKRLNRLLKQLNDLWPEVDILIIAQNWNNFTPIKTKNKQIIKHYEPLGILKARQTLRQEFLKLNYDYIIMFDDDAIIRAPENTATKYMEELDKHPKGFCFIHSGTANRWDDYKAAQLNLCAISKFIYDQEDIPNVDPQKSEAYEDTIYACLLHYKYSQYEFFPPKGITHVQFKNKEEPVASTWAHGTNDERIQWKLLNKNSDDLKDYIKQHRDLPNLNEFFKARNLRQWKNPAKQADGRKGCFLYF